MVMNTLARELKRGSTELLILALLEECERHGYDLARLIDERSRGAITFHVASLYPTLYRMEDKGLVAGRIGEPTAERGGRRKKHYRVLAAGQRALKQSVTALRRMTAGLESGLRL